MWTRRILPRWPKRCGQWRRIQTASAKFAEEHFRVPPSLPGRRLLDEPGRCMPPPRAFFLTPEEPKIGTGGGGLRSASLLAYLCDKYSVQTVTFTLQSHSKKFAARIWRNTIRLAAGRPPLFDRYSGYEDQLGAALHGRYALGVVEHFWCA